MLLHFKPTETMRVYRANIGHKGDSTLISCLAEGEYEFPDAKGEEVLADYPENFTRAGTAKGVKSPERNRAAPPPERNK